MSEWYIIPKEDDLMHYGVKGMKWRNRKGPTVKAKTAKSGAKDSEAIKAEDHGIILNKGTVSSAKKKEMERVYKSYVRNVLKAERAGKKNTAVAHNDLIKKYYNRLNNTEKKQFLLIVKRIGLKPFRTYID